MLHPRIECFSFIVTGSNVGTQVALAASCSCFIGYPADYKNLDSFRWVNWLHNSIAFITEVLAETAVTADSEDLFDLDQVSILDLWQPIFASFVSIGAFHHFLHSDY